MTTRQSTSTPQSTSTGRYGDAEAMPRLLALTYALGLVASPLLLLVYWLLYPAYGDVHSADIFAAIAAAPHRAEVADAFALASCLLAVSGALAYLQVLRRPAPRLGRVGATLAITGWVAVLALLVLDVVAEQPATTERVFRQVSGSPLVLALNLLASLHIVGGVVIGVALLRTRLVPRALAVAGTAAPVVHLVSNLNGVLWVDALTWVVTAALGAVVLRQLLVSEPTDAAPASRVGAQPVPAVAG